MSISNDINVLIGYSSLIYYIPDYTIVRAPRLKVFYFTLY